MKIRMTKITNFFDEQVQFILIKYISYAYSLLALLKGIHAKYKTKKNIKR